MGSIFTIDRAHRSSRGARALSLRQLSPGMEGRPVGGADRARTDDPLLAKQVLSQLSYSPGPEVRGQKAEGRSQTR